MGAAGCQHCGPLETLWACTACSSGHISVDKHFANAALWRTIVFQPSTGAAWQRWSSDSKRRATCCNRQGLKQLSEGAMARLWVAAHGASSPWGLLGVKKIMIGIAAHLRLSGLALPACRTNWARFSHQTLCRKHRHMLDKRVQTIDRRRV